MTIIFISLDNDYIESIKLNGFEAYKMKIEDYKPNKEKKTYYVSPANSLCFMDGGIDLALSRKIFPCIEGKVKKEVQKINKNDSWKVLFANW